MTPCEIETEAGRLTVLVPDRLKKMLKPLQRIWASGLRRMTDKVASIVSFGNTTDILNEFLHRDGRDSFLKTTIADTAGQDGREKEKNDAEFVRTTFEETEWLDENGRVLDISRIPEGIKNPAVSPEGEKLVNEKIEGIIARYNEGRPDAEQIKGRCLIEMIEQCPSKSVFVMVDSILVPWQKEHRNVNGVTGETRAKKTTGIANAYILSIEGTYCFTAGTEEAVMKKVLAYLVHHDLLSNRELIFFADGARSISMSFLRGCGQAI